MLQLATQCLALVTNVCVCIYIYIRLGKVLQLATQCLALVTSVCVYIKAWQGASACHTMPCISY